MTTLRQRLEAWAEREAEKHSKTAIGHDIQVRRYIHFKAGASQLIPIVVELADALKFSACAYSAVWVNGRLIQNQHSEHCSKCIVLADLEKFLEASDGK